MPGGVATLNHRLITVVPPGQIAGVVSCRHWRVLSRVGIGGVVSCRHRSMQMLIDRAEAHLPIPAGISVISRWLSEATPPERDTTRNKAIPEGLQNEEDEVPNDFKFHDEEFWHPSGMRRYFATMSGGVAALNHRLITIVPPGQSFGSIPVLMTTTKSMTTTTP